MEIDKFLGMSFSSLRLLTNLLETDDDFIEPEVNNFLKFVHSILKMQITFCNINACDYSLL